MRITAVILAAGQGTRMRSSLPKVLHPVAGLPMVWYALKAAREATGTIPTLVVGHGASRVCEEIGEEARYVFQEQQLGTGHAVHQAEAVLRGKTDLLLVTSADMPLLRSATLKKLIHVHQEHPGPITMLTVMSENPRGFGRVLRDAGGSVQAIVEEADATPEQLHIRELNAGAYCFSADWLWEHLPHIPLSPKGEYYLTDLVGIAVSEGKTVGALVAEDPTETIGVNTRAHLAEAEAAMRQRINQMWMQAGVVLKSPASTFIDASVTIGRNTTIWPDTYLLEKTCVGENCVLGPNTVLLNAQVGSGCVVRSTALEGVKLGDGERVGPYRYLCAEEK